MSLIKYPIIAIVGRPNVGKSTLFNRICGKNKAVVEDVEGVTRDRNYAFVERFSIPFYVVDTGGFEATPRDELQAMVVEQTRLAIEEADCVLVLFDGNTGVHPGDADVVDLIRRSEKPAHFFVNKVDGLEQQEKVNDFWSLGVDPLIDISALHGHHVKIQLEAVLAALPDYAAMLAAYQLRMKGEEDARYEAEREIAEALAQLPDEDEDEDGFDTTEISVGENDTEGDSFEFAPVFVPAESENDAELAVEAEAYQREYKLRAMPRLARERRDAEEETLEGIDENSAEGGSSVGDSAGDSSAAPVLEGPITVAIIGRPNVGKSTLLNALVGENRVITSDIAGTTRDAVDVLLQRDGQEYIIVDTAGLRKQGKVSESIERYSTMRSLRAISDCDVALLVLDATQEPSDQDAKIIGLAHEEGKGIVIVVNKWDAVEKDHKSAMGYKEKIREAFKFAPYAPLLFISAKTGRRCQNALKEAKIVAVERTKKVQTGTLNRVLAKALGRINLPSYRGRPIKLYFAAQVGQAPPRFALIFNYPKHVHFSVLRYIKNAIREQFGFDGTDIKFSLRSRKSATAG